MSDLLTHIGRFELVDVDLDKEPQCEGRTHPDGGHGHNPSASATWLLHKPCCGRQTLLCAARVAFMRRHASRCFVIRAVGVVR